MSGDYGLLRAINGLSGHSAGLDRVMVGIATYMPILFAAALAAIWIRRTRQEQIGAMLAGAAALIALGVGQLMGMAYPRPRPYLEHPVHLLVRRVHDTSFPSDHATLGFAIAVMVWQVNRRTGAVLLLLGILLAFSRVYVGAHYPTDVLAGALLGAGVSGAAGALCLRGRLRSAVNRLMDSLVRWKLAPGRAPSGPI